jgi:hypothetical protein
VLYSSFSSSSSSGCKNWAILMAMLSVGTPSR